MKKKIHKITAIVTAFCLTFIALSFLITYLVTKRRNTPFEIASVMAASYTTYSEQFDEGRYARSSNALSTTTLPEHVASGVTLSYSTEILGNSSSKTDVELFEQISSMGTIQEYLEVNGNVLGSLEYDDERNLVSNTLHYNNIYYEYDGDNVVEFLNNGDAYSYVYDDDRLINIKLNEEEFANYTYGENGTISKEEYPGFFKLYEHTNIATLEYAFDKASGSKILTRIYDHLAKDTYEITRSEITNGDKTYSLATKVQYGKEWLEFEYDYFYNNVAYITKVTSEDEQFYLSYLNDKIISKTTSTSKVTFIYSSTGELVGLMSGKITDGEYNEGYVNLVKDAFGNVIEANYVDVKYVNEDACNFELEKVYDQQFNSYGNKVYVNNYDANIGVNIGFMGGLSFDELNLVYIDGNLYSPDCADFILNQTNASLNYGLIEQNTIKRQDPLYSSVEKSIVVESTQKELDLRYQTSSVSGLPLYSNEFCVGVADIFTLPVDIDPDNMLKYPSMFMLVVDADNQTEVDSCNNLLAAKMKKGDEVCVLFDNYYLASFWNQPIKFQFIYNDHLYTVESIRDGVIGYSKQEGYSKKDLLKEHNVMNYDTGRYLTYYKSTLNMDDYIQDVSFLTNISSTEDLNSYFADLGMINSSVGQTYADVNFGDNQAFMENLLKNTCELNLPDYDPEKEYLTINENGEYVVNTIPEDASVEQTSIKKDDTLISNGVSWLITGISFVIDGVMMVVTCGGWTVITGIIVLGGAFIAICGVGSIVKGATGSSVIVDGWFNGDIDLMQTVVSVVTAACTVATILGSTVFKSCFVEGTQVETIDGSKNIEDIKVGDYVLSYNQETNEQVYAKVLNTYTSQTTALCAIGYGETTIASTLNHPYYVDGEWVEAQYVQVGDKLTLANNDEVVVNSAKTIDCEATNVYNLNVDITHTYYADGVLVHNACTDPSDFTTKETDELFKSKEFQSTIKEMKAKYPNVDFDDYAQATKFWNSHRTEINNILGKKISLNPKLSEMVPNWSSMIKKGVNPMIKTVSGGKTSLLKINYHHLSGKLNTFDIYPMLRSKHIQFHNMFGRLQRDQYKWKPFADYVRNMVKGIV